ncbi:CD109 [Cordylochernes scorpioides]|uniref:CD109 n=1 Tax=Cordylochernes scorpioides TaxID=51811 RepID=A0ABY6LXH2_9ARAC|nr:CD109 [Cordylochernes scorpioides]
MLYWPGGIGGPSQAIETTAYALMTYVMRGEASGAALPLVRWLISKQNENGGFLSTQDTVIAIQALAGVAKHLASPTISLTVHYSGGVFNISTFNAMILQKIMLPPATRTVSLKAEGFGVGIVQVSWQYNMVEDEKSSLFSLKPSIKNKNMRKFDLDICTHYIGKGEDKNTNMAVMEVGLPSGFQSDAKKLQSLINDIPEVKRVETRQGDSSVVIYFDKIDDKESCLVVPAYKTYDVANAKPAQVKIYDYYNLAKSSVVSYEAPEAVLCDICANDEHCVNKCNDIDSVATGGGDPSVKAVTVIRTLGAILVVLHLAKNFM